MRAALLPGHMGSVLLIVASEAGGTSFEGPIAVEKLHGSVEIRTHISAGMVVAQWPVLRYIWPCLVVV